MSDPEMYRIWSVEHGAWWAPNRRGYVIRASAAGLYTREDAAEICAGSNTHELDDIMVPAFCAVNDNLPSTLKRRTNNTNTNNKDRR